jgi:hypothetical protein
VPGVLTTGDVDLHVRVEPDAFAAARDVLCELYEPLHPERWNRSAYFVDPRSEPGLRVKGKQDAVDAYLLRALPSG